MWKFFKRVFLVLFLMGLAGVAYCVWIYWGGCTSNPKSYATVGDIPTMRGYRRIADDGTGQAAYLRGLPLKEKGAKVELYTGGEARLQSLCYAVVDVPLISNWEQCADVCMRLRAEYLFAAGQYNRICFNDVNGKRLAYYGGNSRKALEKYLKKLYGVASTFSLSREMKTRPLKDIRPGDVFVYPAGRYNQRMGHAIMVADVAVNKNGKKAFLLIEGNTPARSMHVMRNLLNPLSSPWFLLEDDDKHILIDGFPFRATDLKHF